MKHKIFSPRSIILLLWFFPVLIHAQEQPSIMRLIQDSTYQNKFIQIANIASASQETVNFIAEVKSNIQDLSDFTSLINQYETLQKQIRSLTDQAGTGDEEIFTPVVLQKSLYEWNSIRSELLVISNMLSNADSWMAERQRELDKIVRIWENTLQNARRENADNEVLERINFIRRELTEINASLRSAFNEGVKYEVRISESLSEIDNQIKRLNALSEAAYKNLLVPDSPPLLQAIKELRTKDKTPKEFTNFRGLLREKIQELDRYYSSTEYFFQILVLVYIVLIVVTFSLKRRYQSWIEHMETDNVLISILNRPLAVATILTLFIAYYLLPTPVLLLRELFLLIAIFPVLYIILPSL